MEDLWFSFLALAASTIRLVTSSPITRAPRDSSANAMSPVPLARSSARDPAFGSAMRTSRAFHDRSRPYDSSTVMRS